MFDFLDIYPWALPLIIFCSRICDVSLGTMRIIFVSRGEKKIAPVFGFFEVFIWVVIISQVLSRANSVVCFLSYAGGYAAGTFVGLCLEERIGKGFILYRVFIRKGGQDLVALLSKNGCGATLTRGQGSVAEIDIVEAVVSRKETKMMENIIKGFDPKAFFLVENVKGKQRGIFRNCP